jgi:formate hydrogenlyase subunit 4
MFARIGYNLLQVVVVLAFAPLVEGVASRLKEILQSKRGPSIFQPYRDIWKLLHKDEIVSEYSSWIFRAAPYVAFASPIFVALLIPVLTRYPLFFAFMGDMLGGGFILALGGFFTTLAAVDTANPYGPMGASRTRMVGFLAEPVFIVVFLTVFDDSLHRADALDHANCELLRAVACPFDDRVPHADPRRRRAHSRR